MAWSSFTTPTSTAHGLLKCSRGTSHRRRKRALSVVHSFYIVLLKTMCVMKSSSCDISKLLRNVQPSLSSYVGIYMYTDIHLRILYMYISRGVK